MVATFFLPERMLCDNNKYIISYKNGYLVLRDIIDRKVLKKCKIHRFIQSWGFIERLCRYEPRAAVALDSERFIYSDHGGIYEYNFNDNSVECIHLFSKGMNNPLQFCVQRDEYGGITSILYGEYIWNTNNGPVSIYRYNMKEWKEVYTFPSGIIKHIHNIQYDRFNDRFLIMTGDSDSESAIWVSDVNFKNVSLLVGGSQKYRTCIVLPVKNGLYYATDTPLEQNFLFFYDYRRGLQERYKMPGPCIFGRIVSDVLYMATSVEGDPNLPKWRYRLFSKLGTGVQDRKVHIIRCDLDGVIKEIACFQKDWLPMWLFQFGNAMFPPSDNGVYVTTQSTKEKGTYILEEE